MALITCPECGKQISDQASVCPNCGFPVKDSLFTDAHASGSQSNNDKSERMQNSEFKKINDDVKHVAYSTNHDIKQRAHAILYTLRWVISAAVFIFGLLSFIVMGISMLIPFIFFSASAYMFSPIPLKSPYKLTKTSRICLALLALFMALFIGGTIAGNENSNNQIPTAETESQSTEIPSSQSEETETEYLNSVQDSEVVFFLDFVENWKQYTDKYITVSFQVNRYNETEEIIESISKDGVSVTARLKNYQLVETGNYVTVVGMVSTESSVDPVLTNAYLIDNGAGVKDTYLQDEAAYNERKRIEAEEYEALFKETAEAVSFENLARYPDTYESKKIKITVSITKVDKKDSLIFDDSYMANFAGKTIAIYDSREIKEPKLLEGDKVTIYGYGKGLTELKTYDKSGIIPKTISKEKIPAVSVEFIEF